MRGELARVETDATAPLGYEASILSRGHRPVRLGGLETGICQLCDLSCEVVVERPSRRFSALEANGTPVFLLPDIGSVVAIAIGRPIIDRRAPRDRSHAIYCAVRAFWYSGNIGANWEGVA